jgi:flagellar basal body-associated protein FliL
MSSRLGIERIRLDLVGSGDRGDSGDKWWIVVVVVTVVVTVVVMVTVVTVVTKWHQCEQLQGWRANSRHTNDDIINVTTRQDTENPFVNVQNRKICALN